MTMAEVHVELSEDIVTVRRIASDKFRLEISSDIAITVDRSRQLTHLRINLNASSVVARLSMAFVWIRANEEMVFKATRDTQ